MQLREQIHASDLIRQARESFNAGTVSEAKWLREFHRATQSDGSQRDSNNCIRGRSGVFYGSSKDRKRNPA